MVLCVGAVGGGRGGGLEGPGEGGVWRPCSGKEGAPSLEEKMREWRWGGSGKKRRDELGDIWGHVGPLILLFLCGDMWGRVLLFLRIGLPRKAPRRSTSR